MNIETYLKDESNWVKNKANEEIWKYCSFNNLLTVGKQRHDWAIFWFKKNMGFFYSEGYKDIPQDLINKIEYYLNKSKNNIHLIQKND